MKKRIAAALLAALMVFLTACGGGGSAPAAESTDGAATAENPATPAASGDEIVLRYAAWDRSQMPVYEELFRQFEEQNPGIKVVTEETAWKEYWTKMETAITGGSAPDIFWLNIPRSNDYITNGVLLPLDDLNVEKDKFPEAHMNAYSHDGVLYGMVKDFDSQGLFYNKKLFDQAGIPYPTDDWDWNDLKETARQLTEADGDFYGFAAPLAWQGGYYETIYQAGGSPFAPDGKSSNFTDPKTIAGVQYWYDFIGEGISAPLDVMANTPGRDLFDSGKVAMFITGSYYMQVLFGESDNGDDFDVAMLPKGERYACTSNGLANVVYAGTDHPEEAKKLIEFLSTKEAHEHVARSGVVLTAYEGSQQAWVDSFPDKNIKVFIDIIDYAIPLTNFPNSSAATTAENEILAKAWSGQITVEEACQEVAEAHNKILAG